MREKEQLFPTEIAQLIDIVGMRELEKLQANDSVVIVVSQISWILRLVGRSSETDHCFKSLSQDVY